MTPASHDHRRRGNEVRLYRLRSVGCLRIENLWSSGTASFSEQTSVMALVVGNDLGHDHYFNLYTTMKVRHFYGHVECMPHNAGKMVPSHVSAVLDIKKALEESRIEYSGNTLVKSVLYPPKAAVGVDAFSGPTQDTLPTAEEAEELPQVGRAQVSVPLHVYIPVRGSSGINAQLPPNIEFAALAVIAKFKATRIPEITHVDIEGLNDRSLIHQAQSLFGVEVGRLVFRTPHEPYCWMNYDAHGVENVVCMRPRSRGCAMRVELSDVWQFKATPAHDEAGAKYSHMQIKCIVRYLFPSMKTNNTYRYGTFPVSMVAIYYLQLQYSEVDPMEADEFPDKLSDWGQISQLISTAIETNDLFYMLRFLWMYLRKVYGCSSRIGGDRVSYNKAMAEILAKVKEMLVDFSGKGLKRWTPPPTEADVGDYNSDSDMADADGI